MKLNLGSNSKKVKGYKNVDIQDIDNVDYVIDLTKTPYMFEDNEIDGILAEEVLEHISFREVPKVLREWNRILKINSKIHIQVPAIDKMCEMYANGEVCPDDSCIPHKPKGEVKANPNCPYCNGKGKVNLIRWRFAFSGAQKSPYDSHLNHFTKEILERELMIAGFCGIKVKYDKYEWKLKANAYK